MHTPSGVHIEKMIIEALIARGVGLGTLRTLPEKLQRCQHTITPCFPADPPTVKAHGERGEPEPYSSNARERRITAPVFDQAVLWIGLIPEIVECRTLHEVEEGLVIKHMGCRTDGV